MTYAYFIAGTDTEVGKTRAACALLHAFRARGLSAIGMKPVAAGTDSSGVNEDVAALVAASSFAAPPERVNPYCFADPVAPHLAAREAGVTMRAAPVLAAFGELERQADAVIVEGVGGFLVPLADGFDAADLAVALALPVVLVVGMRLGCLNHALLTQEAIRARDLPFAGWIANCIDPHMHRFAENLQTLEDHLKAPLFGVIAHGATAAEAAGGLTLPGLAR